VSARRRAATGAVVAAATLALAGCGGNLGMPDPATEQGDETLGLWRLFFVTAVIIGLIVYGLVAFVLIRYRRRRLDDGRPPGQRQYNVPIEIVYTAVPLIIVGVLFGLSVRVERHVTSTSDQPYSTVRVIGFQWQWQFQYEGTPVVITGVPGNVPVLMLPAERTVRLEFVSPDVVHSFWVPHFLEKRDLTPRIDNNAIDVDVRSPGEWPGLCSEFCGLEHTDMRFIVRAVPAAEFDAWLASGGSGT
jgi:cytochrome c oxidase subunit 2